MRTQLRMLGVPWVIKVLSLTQELHVIFQYPRHYNKLNRQFANLGKISKFFKVSIECSQTCLYLGPLMWVTAGWPLCDQVETEEKDSSSLRQLRDIIRGSELLCYDQLPSLSSKQTAMNKWIDISNQDGSYPRNRCVDSNPWLLPATRWLLIQTNFLLLRLTFRSLLDIFIKVPSPWVPLAPWWATSLFKNQGFEKSEPLCLMGRISWAQRLRLFVFFLFSFLFLYWFLMSGLSRLQNRFSFLVQ